MNYHISLGENSYAGQRSSLTTPSANKLPAGALPVHSSAIQNIKDEPFADYGENVVGWDDFDKTTCAEPMAIPIANYPLVSPQMGISDSSAKSDVLYATMFPEYDEVARKTRRRDIAEQEFKVFSPSQNGILYPPDLQSFEFDDIHSSPYENLGLSPPKTESPFSHQVPTVANEAYSEPYNGSPVSGLGLSEKDFFRASLFSKSNEEMKGLDIPRTDMGFKHEHPRQRLSTRSPPLNIPWYRTRMPVKTPMVSKSPSHFHPGPTKWSQVDKEKLENTFSMDEWKQIGFSPDEAAISRAIHQRQKQQQEEHHHFQHQQHQQPQQQIWGELHTQLVEYPLQRPASMSPDPSSIPLNNATIDTSDSQPVNDSHIFRCPDCNAKFRVRGYLTRHMRKHAEVMKFNCPMFPLLPEEAKCHQTGGFSRGDTFKMHMKARHFVYPKGTARKNRTDCAGECAGCGEHFENNEKWFKEHIMTDRCPLGTQNSSTYR